MSLRSSYPADVAVPYGLETDRFRLRPLRTSDVDLDYEAVMESVAMLLRFGGGNWPAADFALADNLADLARHQQEHEAHIAFTYTVMNLDENRCLGCVYVDSLARLLEAGQAVDSDALAQTAAGSALVRYWARQSEIANGLDRRLFEAVVHWLRHEWLLTEVYFRANERDRRQVETLEAAALQRRFGVQVPGIRGAYLVYGPV